MDGRRIDGGGDIHEFEAESAIGKREIADVANESNIGVVNGDVQVGLIGEAGRVIGSRRTHRVFLLRRIDFAAAGVTSGRTGAKHGHRGNHR